MLRSSLLCLAARVIFGAGGGCSTGICSGTGGKMEPSRSAHSLAPIMLSALMLGHGSIFKIALLTCRSAVDPPYHIRMTETCQKPWQAVQYRCIPLLQGCQKRLSPVSFSKQCEVSPGIQSRNSSQTPSRVSIRLTWFYCQVLADKNNKCGTGAVDRFP